MSANLSMSSETEFPPAARPRLRVVISAFGLSPIRGSEAATAWQHVSRITRYHDVVALCFPGLRGEIVEECEKFFAANGPHPGLSIEFIEPPPFARLLERNSSSVLRAFVTIGNRSWQKAAFARAQALHRQQPFDAAHQLTITGYREPGFLWKLGVPFFWGPVTGASDVPWRYLSLMGWRDRLAYSSRNIANFVQMRIAPRPRRAARAASEVWAVGQDNLDMVTGRWGVPATQLFETGTLPPRADQPIRTFQPGQKLRMVTAGYLVGRKALSIALRALAIVGDRIPWEYTVMGHGPAKEGWMALAKDLGLGDRVRWTGNLPHAEALAELQSNHLFLFPSLKEGTPNVVPEALTKAVPVLCHEMCGMGLMVNDTCGIKVVPRGPAASARGFADAILKLATTEGEIERLSRGALIRAAQITWDRNAQIMAEAYWRHSAKTAPAQQESKMRVVA
jgi:glycosyltransferase involved in cell wall biosynthesis